MENKKEDLERKERYLAKILEQFDAMSETYSKDDVIINNLLVIALIAYEDGVQDGIEKVRADPAEYDLCSGSRSGLGL